MLLCATEESPRLVVAILLADAGGILLALLIAGKLLLDYGNYLGTQVGK
jgi:hypothetical protein